MTYDLGMAVRLSTSVVDLSGAAANVSTMTLTVTLPDATTSVVSPVTVSATTGSYVYDFTTTQAGRHSVKWAGTGSVLWSFTDVFDVRDSADLPVVGLADAKRHLNITSTTSDDELRRFLDVATDLCENYAGRALRRRTFTETHDGGSPTLLLRWTPVVSVTTVTDDGTAVTDYLLEPESGVLWRDDDGLLTWAGSRRGVTVTYVAGYTSPPADVQQAVLEALRHLWTTQRGTMSGRNPLAGDEYANGTGWSLPRRVTELLEPYRMVGIA